jgi:hypothetical protein
MLDWVLGLLLFLVIVLPGVFFDRWLHKAARENEKEFEQADSNRMSAWKHFPW